MNRGLVYSLCAAALAVAASPALAAVNLQLNLKYTDPNNPTGGGTWDLLVKSTGGAGVSGVKALIGGNTGVTGVDTGPVSFTGAAWNNTDDVARFQLTGGSTEIAVGSDLAPVPAGGQLTVGAGGNGNVAADDLFTNGSTASNWNNSSKLASGSWTGARPTLTAVEANVFSGTTAVAGTLGSVVVRGDSVGADGLKQGDANRDGRVNGDDFNLLAFNFGQSGKNWGQGDFNSSGNVNGDDFNLLAFNFGLASASPGNTVTAVAAVGAVPEPASVALLVLSVCGGLIARRQIK